jgi:hypothetical protein
VSGGMSEKSISDSGIAASRSSIPRCLFVRGLLKTRSAFVLTSFSGRDDTDDFFAIFRLPVNVDDDQEGLKRSMASTSLPQPAWLARSFAASHSNRTCYTHCITVIVGDRGPAAVKVGRVSASSSYPVHKVGTGPPQKERPKWPRSSVTERRPGPMFRRIAAGRRLAHHDY